MVGLMSVQEKIDTSSSGSQLVFHIFGALAEFERNLARAERADARGQPASVMNGTGRFHTQTSPPFGAMISGTSRR